MPIYAGLSGLIVNSYLRRMLMIHTRPLITAFPMAILPGLALKIGWYAYVTEPVLAGDLHCSICGEMRGGLVNVALGKVLMTCDVVLYCSGIYCYPIYTRRQHIKIMQSYLSILVRLLWNQRSLFRKLTFVF